MTMDMTEFEKMKTEFGEADVDRKVMMYVSAAGLTQEQYRELLKLFPITKLHLLEEALY